MLYPVLIVFIFLLSGLAAYGLFKSIELAGRLRKVEAAWRKAEDAYLADLGRAEEQRQADEREVKDLKARLLERIAAHAIETEQQEKQEADFAFARSAWAVREAGFQAELAKLETIRHVPNLIERAEQALKAAQAERDAARTYADDLILKSEAEGKARAQELTRQAQEERDAARRLLEQQADLKSQAETRVQETLRIAELQAQQALDAARAEARDLASKARKDSKEKKEQAAAALDLVTRYALEIREQAERRALDAAAFEAKTTVDELRAQAEAYRNRIHGYEGVYLVPPAQLLDELADEFGFSKAGEKLKLARERTRIMQENGTAAACGYTEGWKKDHALKFVLSTFNGKVDTILARLKPANQGKLIQEIKDAYALVNKDGEVYRNARIRPEYLDSRLDELKWGTAVLKLKEKSREEQREIRDQMRDEAKAQREIERAVKQAAREEELVNRAIAKIRKQLSEANEAERARLEAQLQEMDVRLAEAEERGRRAISMAEQTKKGHVYIISNVGSFGENVYKIGLTRRLEPTDRVRELGGASVPFPFDVHALLASDDAPATEAALHRHFVERQVNKVNKRKEFFRVSLEEIREAVEEMGLDGTWTIASEASEYRETILLEQTMKSDLKLRRQWLERQAALPFFDDESDELDEEDSNVATTAVAGRSQPASGRRGRSRRVASAESESVF